MDRFGLIHDFRYNSAKKLENSSYLEDLTSLLAKTAALIDSETNYLFGKEYYIDNHSEELNSGFYQFVDCFKKSYYEESFDKINIIRGRAGIGKSFFFKQGIKQLIRPNNCKSPYINMGVDFKSIDNDKDINFYIHYIYEKLHDHSIDCIRYLDSDTYRVFQKDKREFGIEDKTPLYYLFPLKFFCEKIYNKYGIPCVITFDNIDLASVLTQEHVFKAIVVILNEFNNFMRSKCSLDCYRIYFVMRPETELRYKEINVGEVINFPLPNIFKISLTIMKKVIIETATEFDFKRDLPCNVICKDVTRETDEMRVISTFRDVANYFVEIMDLYLIHIWDETPNICERLGTCEEFHCNIVNYNVRTFLRFLSDTISNGGFKPLTTEFNHKQSQQHYNTFDYIEMIIRGRWQVHPGNIHIHGEGSNKAPIVFNIFDTSLYGGSNKVKVQHFMLNVRILQYFMLCTTDLHVNYKKMKRALSKFFDKKLIEKATKKLIHTRFLYSFELGDDMVATISNWEDVPLNKHTELKLSPVGRFYLVHMICEFEYLYQMALSSLMCEEYLVELNQCWKVDKERTVLYFLKSMFQIIKLNISGYIVDNELDPFKKLFYYIDDEYGSRPFRRMIERFISVMESKVQSANRFESHNAQKLKSILEEVIELKNNVENYFESVLEG